MKFAIGIATILAAAIAAAGLASCGQSEGQRCQVQADCAGSLVCNLATNTCESTTSNDLDADPPPDTFIIKFDSRPGSEPPAVDAMPDAPDAGVDGAPSDI